MARYIIRRLIRAAITLIVFQTFLFLLIQTIPWDYANLIRTGAVQQRAIRHVLGLDLPVGLQFANWMERFFSGNLGVSFQFGVSVGRLFLQRMPRTLLLFLPGTVIGFLIGVSLGKRVAWRRGGLFEVGVTLGGVAFYTSFAPWLAFVLVNIFALQLGWLPPENLITPNVWANTPAVSENITWRMLVAFSGVGIGLICLWRITRKERRGGLYRLLGVLAMLAVVVGVWEVTGEARFTLDILRHLALPLTTLVLLSFGETMLLMRATMMDTLTADHVLVARAIGLPASTIRDRHVARLALLPVLARFIVQLPLVIIGSFVLERVFFWQGVGEMMFNAIDHFDIPVVMGILSLVGVLMLLSHVLLDILSVWLDPRLRDFELFRN
jgi:peptide/nickel transport system permease protein